MKKSKTKAKTKLPCMVVRISDYIIALDDNGKRKHLIQVHNVDGLTINGTLDHNRAYDPQTVETTMDKVICVLGPNPENGSAFGVRVEPFRRTLEHEDWGNTHWFVNMKREDKVVLKTALTRVAKLLKRKGLFGFVNDGNLETEILPPKGKYTGMYIFRQKGEEAADRMQLRPKAGVDNSYVIAHESGHGVWFRLLSEKQRARWVQFYNKFTKNIEHDEKVIAGMRDDFIKARTTLSGFRSDLGEEEGELFDLIIGSITSNYRLTKKHLDMLATNGFEDEFTDMWPETVEDSDFEIPVSEYGTTKPEELFAEAFAFWLLGTKLPKSVQALMDKTLQKVARRGKE